MRVARARMRTFGHAVRAAGVDRPTGQDDRRERAVRAAVHDDLDVLGEEPAVRGHARPVAHDRRMALGRRGDVLVAVVDHPHRTARLPREERGVEGDDRGVLLLAAEPAAGLGLDHARLAVIEPEAALQRGVDVVGALERPGDGDTPVVAGRRDHRVVLDVELLLVADAVFALEHEVRGPEGRLDLPGFDRVACEDMLRFERVEDRLERLGADADMRLRRAQRRAVRRGDQGEGLGVVLDLAADRDEDGLVGLDRADDVVAGDVVGGHDHDRRPVEGRVEVEGGEPRVRLGRSDGGAEPGARDDEVVSVLGRAGQLLGSFAPGRRQSASPARSGGAGRDDERSGRFGTWRHLVLMALLGLGAYHRRGQGRAVRTALDQTPPDRSRRCRRTPAFRPEGVGNRPIRGPVPV